MKRKIQFGWIIAGLLLLTLGACKKDTVSVTIIPLYDTLQVKYSNTGSFSFYSFRNGNAVLNSDSNSTHWDFALRRTTMILNSHASGPGRALGQLVNQSYTDLKMGPVTGYGYDTTTTQLAIKDGSWYDYDGMTNTYTPKANQTFVFRTADNFYVKMQVVAMNVFPATGTPVYLFYHFKYTYQADGTVKFY